MRRYLALYLAFVVLFGALVPAAINFVIDPYQYFRQAWYTPRFSTNERWQLPGLARVYFYDTIILGTSMAQNFYPSAVEAAIGGQVLKLAMSGSTVHEQSLLFEVARRTGQVKRVLWSLDEMQCQGPADRVNASVDFPYFLYEGGPRAWAGYLLNASMLKTSLDIALSWPQRRPPGPIAVPDDFNSFDRSYRFDRERAIAHYMVAREAVVAPPLDVADMLESCAVNVIGPIRRNPTIAFDVILPPYSILLWKLEQERNPARLRQWLAFSTEFIERLVTLRNVRVFDFRDVVEITHDLDHYKDMTHFDAFVARYIAGAIAAGRHQVDPTDPAASLRRLESQIVSYQVPAGPV
jgi:hypothetical protein